ncbi:MAG TPA: hypothetical protein VNR11_03395 [Xanthobacteraceae bacterium]|nr:hypothetical protein [Xanthobacteraceae bacterium]
MTFSKAAVLAASVAFPLSASSLSTMVHAQSAASAQPQNYPGDMMSDMGEDEAIYLKAETGRITKSKKKVSDATHAKAMQHGARALAQGSMIYRKGGKIYLLENKPGSAPGKTMIQENFQEHWDGAQEY